MFFKLVEIKQLIYNYKIKLQLQYDIPYNFTVITLIKFIISHKLHFNFSFVFFANKKV